MKLAAGTLRGAFRPSGGAEFLGIPYAQAPVGALRWHEPIPVGHWRGVRDATSIAAPCLQPVLGQWNKHDAETSKENCLFLNVITPVWPPRAPLPVMFWIHGGGEGGSGSGAQYKDGTLTNHGVLLVTLDYRLGVFGFLAHRGLSHESEHAASGNYGLMDQIAALQWVRANIAKFGGDPANITVFGQSTGAQYTSLLMTSPVSKSLFHRAIVESGAAINPSMPFLSQSEQAGEKFAAKLKVHAGDDAIKSLRRLSPQLLMSAAASIPLLDRLALIGPNIDGWIISRSPSEVFAEGQQASIPMIIGTTSREFTSSLPLDELRKYIENYTGRLAPRALSLYGLAANGQGIADPLYGTAADQWFVDVFRCPIVTQAQFHDAAHHATYEYELQHAIPGEEAQGAGHSADLPYVFGFYAKSDNISGDFTEADYKLADWIESYWTNFAKTGNPNGGSLPNWPEFGNSQTYTAFTQDGRVVPIPGGLRRSQCDLLRDVLKQQMAHQRSNNE